MPDLSSSRISQSILSLNRTSSHDNHIQEFQREHTQLSIPHPIMLSPSKKQQSMSENLKYKLLSIDSSTNLTDSDNTNDRIIQSTTEEDQQISDDNSNSNKSITIDNESNITFEKVCLLIDYHSKASQK